MPQGRKVRQDDSTFERTRLKAKSKPIEKPLLDALIAEDGPLPCGMLPAIKTASDNGAKMVYQMLDDEGRPTQKISRKKPAETDKTEVVQPKTPADIAGAKMAVCLEQVTKARAKSLQLSGVSYGKELSNQLLSHAQGMEALWKRLHSLVEKGEAEKHNQVIMGLVAEIDKLSKWWTKAEASFCLHLLF